MNSAFCCLTLVFPKSVEESVIDLLLEHPSLAPGFTTADVEGHGQGTVYQTAREQVRGRARKVKMEVVGPRKDADALIAILRERLPSREIAFWIHPVLEFGRLS